MINNKISSNQLAIISFLLFMAPLAFIRSDDLNNNITDSVFSFITVVLVTLLLSIPLFMKNEISKENKFICVLYSIYFVFIIVTDISSVTKMLVNTVIPEGDSVFIALSTLLIAVYGALKGVETVGRSAGIVFFLFVSGAVFIILSAFQNIGLEEYTMPFSGGINNYIDNTVLMLSAVSFIPFTFVLKENVKGKFGIKYIVYIIVAMVLGVAFLLETQSCLGYYALTQQYPLYTLSAVTKAEPLKRLDLIFIIIFVMASVIRTSVAFLCIFKLSDKSTLRWKNTVKILYLTVIFIFSALLLSFEKGLNLKLTVYIRAILLIILSIPIPIFMKIIDNRRRVR